MSKLLGLSCVLVGALGVSLASAPTRARGPSGTKGLSAGAAKNIIVLVCDGCGYNHVDAASLYQYGAVGVQVYEQFPVQLGMSTYPAGGSYDPRLAWEDFDYVRTGYADSAAAATAMSTGIKTYNGAVGVDLAGQPLTHVMEEIKQLGKSKFHSELV